MQRIVNVTFLSSSFVVLASFAAGGTWLFSSPLPNDALEILSSPSVDADQQDRPTQDRPTQDRPTEVEVRRELNRLLDDEQNGLEAAVTYLDQVVDQFPTDNELHLIAISLHVSRGMRLLAEEKTDEAKAAYWRAEMMAEQVVADPKHLQAAEPMLGEVFVFAAQAHALDSNEAQLYKSLDKAFELGFEKFEVFDTAKPFESLRQETKFQEYLVRQKGLMSQRMQARLQRQLDAFESFEFNFDLTTVDGKKVAKADYRGKVLVVDVWGTWCPPCRKEIPNFIALQDKYATKGVQVVGLNIENDETVELQTERVQKAIEDFKINYPCALIEGDFLDTIPNFQGFPTSLLLDATGKVRLMLVGAQPESRLETAIQLLLDESNSRKP